jgi:hypothetical protein
MRTIYISFALFSMLLLSLIFSINYLDKVCTKLDTMNIEIDSNVKKAAWTKAEATSSEFLKEWKSSTHKLSLFIDHKEMDNINNELWKLTQYIDTKNKDEALASNNVIKFYIEHIKDMERVSMENIF